MTNRPHDGLNQRGQRKCRHRLIRISYISYIEKVQQEEFYRVSHVESIGIGNITPRLL